MFRNHLLVALRNFRKKRAFTIINVFGLTIGMTVALLILTYARYEISYDRFHSRADQVYRVSVDILDDGKFQVADAQCYPGVGQLALSDFPEIEDYAMARHIGRVLLRYNETGFNEDQVYFANEGWLKVFDWDMISGNPETALSGPDQIVLTESVAQKFFGNEDPVGKMIDFLPGGGKVPMLITGVVRDVPENTHLSFDVLVSWETGVKHFKWKHDEWNQNNEFLYLLTSKAQLDDDFEARFNKVFYEKTGYEEKDEMLRIYALTDIHLKSDRTYEAQANGNQSMVNILLMVAVFVLTIAWVNYINLATARAMERGKEVGVRKVLGSSKGALVVQFFTEAILINLLSLILTVTSIQGVLPLFNSITGTSLSFDLFADSSLLLQLAVLFFVGALASGLYPSLVLSNYRPLAVLTGRLKNSGKGLLLRKGLVIFQFSATMLLLVGTITVYQQVNYMRSQDLGIDLSQTIVVKSPIIEGKRDVRNEKRQTFRSELLNVAQVSAVSFSGTIFGQPETEMSSTTSLKAVSTDLGEGVNTYLYNVDQAYIPTFGLKLLAGRGFDQNKEVEAVDDPGRYHVLVINESLRKVFGFGSNEQAIGEKVQFGPNQYAIIGVMEDHNHNSLKNKVAPMLFLYDEKGLGSDFMSVKINAGIDPGKSYKSALTSIEKVYREVYAGSDFDYYFLDEQFNEQYNADQQFGLVFSIFSGLSVLISILGLFGLGLYEIQQRIKEIGIRKVLGASIGGIIRLFSGHFLKLITISIIVALPLAYLGADRWLDSYAYRIGLSWVLFVVPALTILFIAFVTIMGQTIKVARKNPVDALRYE